MFEVEEKKTGIAQIKVIGVGGGGNNAVNRMIEDNVENVEFVAINTDADVLSCSKADKKVQIGVKLTKGLGAGARPEIGEKSAEEAKEEIAKVITGADIVFITAGMGGGTGTGAAPRIAEISRSLDVLTIGVVTKPFLLEGKIRKEHALKGIDELKKYVDTLVVIPNDKIFEASDKKTPAKDGFKLADAVLKQAIQGISDLITKPGDINVDFADLKTIMTNKGVAHIGIGRASGENKAEGAVEAAINSPLLETTIDGAKNIIVNICGGEDLAMLEVQQALTYVNDLVDDDAEIIIGTSTNGDLQDEVIVTIIATELGCERCSVSTDTINNTKVDENAFRSDVDKIKARASVKTENNAQAVDVTKNLVDNNDSVSYNEPERIVLDDTYQNTDGINIPDFLRQSKKRI